MPRKEHRATPKHAAAMERLGPNMYWILRHAARRGAMEQPYLDAARNVVRLVDELGGKLKVKGPRL